MADWMTSRAESPIFHVILTDHDVWAVEVEWADGKMERVETFKTYGSAAKWIATESSAWLKP
jgi:hypothetical protein